MHDKRAVEHYKGHEIVCVATADAEGWHYMISIVGHKGDASAVKTEKSSAVFGSDTAALQAGASHARQLVDGLLK